MPRRIQDIDTAVGLRMAARRSALAEAYPRITDPAVRNAVTRVFEALASG